jgi:Ni/Co efflux regulator RcnB
MRKTLLLTLVLCVIAVAAYAQAPAATGTGTSTTTSTTATPTGTTSATTTTKTTKHHKKAAATKKYKGEVASVDATAKSFVVHPAKGDDVTLKVNDKTKYSKGHTWDDVKAGAAVSGSYKNDGTDNWAITVNFPKAAAAPAAKTGK